MVEAVSSHTSGLNTVDMADIMPLSANAILSAFFMASLLGTSSPNTSVK